MNNAKMNFTHCPIFCARIFYLIMCISMENSMKHSMQSSVCNHYPKILLSNFWTFAGYGVWDYPLENLRLGSYFSSSIFFFLLFFGLFYPVWCPICHYCVWLFAFKMYNSLPRFITIVDLKQIDSQIFLQQYSETTENCNSGHAAQWQTTHKSRETKENVFLWTWEGVL